MARSALIFRAAAVLAIAAIIAVLAFPTTAATAGVASDTSAAHHHHALPATPPGQSVGEPAIPSADAPHYPVILNEMSIATGWLVVRAGPIVLDIRNAGTVTHELVVIRTDVDQGRLAKRANNPAKVVEDGSYGEAEDIAPGASASLALDLPPGRYVLVCNEPGHYAAGMHAAFTAVSFVGVTLNEMSIALDRASVPAGPVVFNVTNGGTVEHELVVLRTDLPADKIPARPAQPNKAQEPGSLGEVEDIEAGHFSGLSLDLQPGTYVLICNESGHYAAGMRTAFRVTAPTVNVTLKEMSIQLDRTTVPAGHVTFAITNGGTIEHELVVLRTDLDEDKIPARPTQPNKAQEPGSVGEVEDIDAGRFSGLDLILPPGHYVVICNESGHYMAGMRATLTVR